MAYGLVSMVPFPVTDAFCGPGPEQVRTSAVWGGPPLTCSSPPGPETQVVVGVVLAPEPDDWVSA